MARRGVGDRVMRPWSPQEDELQMELVVENEMRNWSTISNSIPSQSGKSYNPHWCNQLSPGAARRPLLPHEDKVIMEAHAQVGNKWAHIAKLPSGRTDNAVKNPWNSTIRRRLAVEIVRPEPARTDPEVIVTSPGPADGALDGYRPMLMPEGPYPIQVNELDTTLSLSLPRSSSGCFHGAVPYDLDLVGSGEMQMQEEVDLAPSPPLPDTRVWSWTEFMEEYIDWVWVRAGGRHVVTCLERLSTTPSSRRSIGRSRDQDSITS